MTMSQFDPICFGQYPADNVPELLHFQFEGSDDIFRYVQVERIPMADINPATRRKEGEGPEAGPIRAKYLPKPPEPKPVKSAVRRKPKEK